MMKFYNINRVYRESVPEAGGEGAGGPEAAPEVPEDDGNDTIPSESDFWSELDKDLDEDSTDVEPSPEPAPEDTPEAPAEEEEEPAPAEPEPEPPEEPEPTPEEQPTKDEPEETPSEPEPQPSEEELVAKRQKFIDEIKSHYALDEEQRLQMVANPETAVLDLVSRMYADIWEGMQTMLRQQMPTLVETGLKEVEERNEYVDKFFSAFPKLNRKDHGDTVAQVARVYAQTNPNATEEQVVKFVGMQTMLMHGIAPDMVSEQGTPTPPAQEPEVPPYQPPSVNGTPPPASKPSNEWEAYAEELLEDDVNY